MGSRGSRGNQTCIRSCERCADGLEEVMLTCHYDGAPNYRVDIKAPDYPSAESIWEDAREAAKKQIETVDGSIVIERL